MDKNTELQEQWEVLSTKIRGLRKAIATEPNPTHKLNSQRELEEAEKERSELEEKIDFIQEDRIILNLKGSNNEVHCVFKDWAIIGRSPTCGFWIDDDSHQISNLHAAISYNLKTSDLWALGVCAYSLLTGIKPFEGDTEQDLSKKILLSIPEPPSQVLEEIDPNVDPYNFGVTLLLANGYFEVDLYEECKQVCDYYLAISSYSFEFSDLKKICQLNMDK
ncbi:MAG: hypothetical protein F6K18_02275 [Okeania sp. SIO2C2]|uniref:hypothetical protein n=1 Tax=Okeania sp. SIO2C2 TaxID=2607787 RepID=UPI0013B8A5AC|nr:hypothetical protein [Okeania sp. SIO2C2]NEP85740.1 hypothetical protein [Okeania sp. SIO2C2]